MLLSFDVEVVDIDIPLLQGLEFLDAFMMTIDLTIASSLARDEGWDIPLLLKGGHLYITWDAGSVELFSEEKLRRVHLHFFHPESQRLYGVLRRARPDEISHQTL